MKILSGLEPASVFGFFEDICNIPHTSYHEKQLSDYCVNFAKERDLYYEQDQMGNVIIISEATKGYEEVEPIMLQGHLDMVGDKLPACQIDMEKEPIRVMVDGDFLTADGTTLGADDGIAAAYCLALLDAEDIPHPRLEVVLTVGEEVGLLGASGIDLSCCRAKRLLNIDSEEEGIFTAGCAGGVRVDCEIPVEMQMKSGLVCEICSQGFLGGHSGIEIDKGRANGNVVLGRFLLYLKEKAAADVISIVGGVKDNVIPKHVCAKLLVPESDADILKKVLLEFNEVLAAEYKVSDPNAQLVLEVKEVVQCEVLSKASGDKAITALCLMPNGVQKMSHDLPGLVETSLNMGVVKIDSAGIHLCFSLRSSLDCAKEFMKGQLKELSEVLGGSVSYHGDYPGWPFEKASELRDLCVRIYERQHGKEPKIEIIHAGLECGILSSKVEGLDCISIGPDMYDVHTPDERLSIRSVQSVWEFLKAVLAEK